MQGAFGHAFSLNLPFTITRSHGESNVDGAAGASNLILSLDKGSYPDSLAPHHKLLNLGSAIGDGKHSSIPEVPLHRILVGKTHGPVNLDRLD